MKKTVRVQFDLEKKVHADLKKQSDQQGMKFAAFMVRVCANQAAIYTTAAEKAK